MAIRESNTVNAIQAVNKHVQAAIAMLEAFKEDSDKILPVKRSCRTQTVKGKQHTFPQKSEDKNQQYCQSH